MKSAIGINVVLSLLYRFLCLPFLTFSFLRFLKRFLSRIYPFEHNLLAISLVWIFCLKDSFVSAVLMFSRVWSSELFRCYFISTDLDKILLNIFYLFFSSLYLIYANTNSVVLSFFIIGNLYKVIHGCR